MSGFGFPPVWLSVVAHSQFPLNSGIGVVHPWFPSVERSKFVCLQFSPSLELFGCPLSVLPKFRSWCSSALGSPPVWSLVLLHPQLSPSLELGAFPPPVWSLVLCHPQFHPALELAACPLSILREFGVWGLSALCCPWIWSSEVVCPGPSFLGMCPPVWGCSCGCFPIPVSP